MNLHMYIPPKSAHPPGLLKGLVYGRLRTYWDQNTNPNNFAKMTKLLFNRLQLRGYSKEHLLPRFNESLERLQNTSQHQNTLQHSRRDLNHNEVASPNKKKIFYHLAYHPRGVQRQEVRHLYDHTVGPLLPNRQLTIAVSRPPNLRDGLCSSDLVSLPNQNPSDFLPSGDL
jgi:hypothetical protein